MNLPLSAERSEDGHGSADTKKRMLWSLRLYSSATVPYVS